jgi:hypothetical protein
VNTRTEGTHARRTKTFSRRSARQALAFSWAISRPPSSCGISPLGPTTRPLCGSFILEFWKRRQISSYDGGATGCNWPFAGRLRSRVGRLRLTNRFRICCRSSGRSTVFQLPANSVLTHCFRRRGKRLTVLVRRSVTRVPASILSNRRGLGVEKLSPAAVMS